MGRFALWFLVSVLADTKTQTKKVNVREVVLDSAVADVKYCGRSDDKPSIILLTKTGRMYRTENEGNNWKDLTSEEVFQSAPGQKATSIARIEVHKQDPNILLAQGTHLTHFISENGGQAWRPLKQRATIHKLIFHPTRPTWMLLSSWTEGCKKIKKSSDEGPCNHMLFQSRDLGRSFSLVHSYVVQFSWGSVVKNQQDRIYFSHFREKTGDQPKLTMWSKNVDFVYTDDGGASIHRLVFRGNKFGVLDGFIFVAKLKSADEQTVNLYVSSDGGKTFNIVRLPEELAEMSYTILDTSEDAVILHVNHGRKEGMFVGNVYISDATGSRYTLSLPNNIRDDSGECEFDSVAGINGIYMANYVFAEKEEQTLKQEDQEESGGVGANAIVKKGKSEAPIRTVITFDKGGEWSFLAAPKVDSLGNKVDCPADKCWLHLHGKNADTVAPFYSAKNAVGLIIATGNVGPYLRNEPDQSNTYLSRDAGLTWVEAHKGAFTYEFGDHGGLILMASGFAATREVVFSWNEGFGWYDFQLGSEMVEIDNIITEPSSTSLKFLVMASRSGSGVVYNINFDGLQQPTCKGVWAAGSVSSDYEVWIPTDGRNRNNNCLLGRQTSYTRRKPSSECFNGEKFERPVVHKTCACDKLDFECELGFQRDVSADECYLVNARLATPEDCTAGVYIPVAPYRRVAGDSCEGGWSPPKIDVLCPGSSTFTRGALYVLFTIAAVILLMMVLQYVTQHPEYKHFFTNFGFDSFGSVKYDRIGGDGPETALESVGNRYDADFIQDDYEEDAPRLVSYEREMRHEEVRRIDTAASHIPVLQRPDISSDFVDDLL